MTLKAIQDFFSKCADVCSFKKAEAPVTDKVMDIAKNFEKIIYRYQNLVGDENIWLDGKDVVVQPSVFTTNERESLQEIAERVGYTYTETCPMNPA